MKIVKNTNKNKPNFYDEIDDKLKRVRYLASCINTFNDNDSIIDDAINELTDMLENTKQKMRSLEIRIYQLEKSK